jgi:hypothetical protein
MQDDLPVHVEDRRQLMSIYNTFKRAPRSDVHHVAEHTPGPARVERNSTETAPAGDWTGHRKASPAAAPLKTTAAWMENLPAEVQPHAIYDRMPRIVNVVAVLWSRPDAAKAYLDSLLVDRRGGRKGFAKDILDDIHKLQAYYVTLHPDCWGRPGQFATRGIANRYRDV